MDLRRRQYVPISVHIATSRTGRRLLQKFGRDGLLVWVLVLAAAKRSDVQGEFRYDSEQDGWERLGLDAHRPDFTLKEFFDYTGRMHNTKKNDDKTTQIRAWNEWNTSIRLSREVERKRRKRAQNTAPLGAPEVEVEGEEEAIGRPAPNGAALSPEEKAANAANAKRLLDQLTGKLGKPTPDTDIPF